jgi:GNAT superfamily N-acetyltransferase
MRHTLVVPDNESNGFHGLYCFLRNQTLIVAVSPDLLATFHPRAEGWCQADVLDIERFRRLIDYPIDQIIGPAFIGYTDRTMFCPFSAEETRLLGSEDLSSLEALQAACNALEWKHGGSQLGDQPVIGAFHGERLVSVSGYEIWDGGIAHISVVTHPQYRGQGYGKAVVSKLTDEALKRGLVPQYRTLEANKSSMALGNRLGFERYATTVAVRLKRSH